MLDVYKNVYNDVKILYSALKDTIMLTHFPKREWPSGKASFTVSKFNT